MRNPPPPPPARRPRRPTSYRRRATLDICGPGGRRPGGRLFLALCELADRFAARRGDPWANRVGTVLTHLALECSRTGDQDDFRLALRSSLDLLVEVDPIERWAPPPPDPPPPDPLPPGQPTPVPYPPFAGATLLALWERR